MVVSRGFDSATGLSTGDNLDHALATSRDAAQLTPNLRDDPDAGGQIRSAAHGPTPNLRDDPDAGGQIRSAAHGPTPSLRDDPDAGGQIRSAAHGPTPSPWDDPDAGGQIRSAVHRPAPNLRDDPDAGGQIHSAVHRPAPGLRDDPDAGGQIHSGPFAGGEQQLAPPDMASASDQLVMRGVTPQLVQAMASFFAAGAADTSRSLLLGAEPSQQPFLATPQHA